MLYALHPCRCSLTGNPGNSTWPKGWLNILVFDKNYNLIDLAYEQLNRTYYNP